MGVVAINIKDAAKETRKYFFTYYDACLGPVVCIDDGDNTIIRKCENEDEAESVCDRLNLIAVLEAIREPSETMVDAAVYRAMRDQIPAHVLSVNWRVMIDALISELKS